MCTYTHLTALPQIHTLRYLHYSTILPSLPHKCSLLTPRHAASSTDLLPPATNAPQQVAPRTPPTPHPSKNTTVSIKSCTYHPASTHIHNTQNHKTTLPIGLPFKCRRRRSSPRHTDCTELLSFAPPPYTHTLCPYTPSQTFNPNPRNHRLPDPTQLNPTPTCQKPRKRPPIARHTLGQPLRSRASTAEPYNLTSTSHESPRANTPTTPAEGKPKNRPQQIHIRHHTLDTLILPHIGYSVTQHDPYKVGARHNPTILQCKHHKQTQRQLSLPKLDSPTLTPPAYKTKFLTKIHPPQGSQSHRNSHTQVDPRTNLQMRSVAPRSLPLPSDSSAHTCTHPQKQTQLSTETCSNHNAAPFTLAISPPSLQCPTPPHCPHSPLQIPQLLIHPSIPLFHSHTGIAPPSTLDRRAATDRALVTKSSD